MKTLLTVSILMILAARGLFGAGASVVSVAQRLNALESARDLVAKRSATWKDTVDAVADPFYRSVATKQGEPAQVSVTELSDRDILRKIAPEIEPSGHFVVGGESVLLVKGRRLKVGDVVNITFEGRVYQVAISSIESNSFSLQLNGERLRRELK